jgi:hypothetical protein
MLKFVAVVSFLVSGAFAQADQLKWTIENVAPSANGNRQMGLALGADHRVHAAFTGCTDSKCKNNDLMYAVRSPEGKWQTAVVDSDKNQTGMFATLVAAADGVLHMFYSNNYKTPALHHAWRSIGSDELPDTAWSTEVAGTTPGGFWISAAVGPTGELFVANTLIAGADLMGTLQLATLSGGKWTFATPDTDGDTGWFTSTAILPDGSPVIAYMSDHKYPVGDLMVARRSGTGWVTETVDQNVVKNSMVVDRDGFIHLAYNQVDASNPELRGLSYATNRPDGTWHAQKLIAAAPGVSTGQFPSIAIDARGGIHIVHYDDPHDRADYARNVGNGWEFSEIGAAGQGGYYAELKTDSDGGLHVLWDTGDTLQYVTCAGCAK